MSLGLDFSQGLSAGLLASALSSSNVVLYFFSHQFSPNIHLRSILIELRRCTEDAKKRKPFKDIQATWELRS